MPIIEHLSTEHVLAMKAEADAGGTELEPTAAFLRHELARRMKLGDTTLLALAAENDATGVYNADDGTPDAPPHDDVQWQTDFRRTEG